MIYYFYLAPLDKLEAYGSQGKMFGTASIKRKLFTILCESFILFTDALILQISQKNYMAAMV